MHRRPRRRSGVQAGLRTRGGARKLSWYRRRTARLQVGVSCPQLKPELQSQVALAIRLLLVIGLQVPSRVEQLNFKFQLELAGASEVAVELRLHPRPPAFQAVTATCTLRLAAGA
jgi:hypothetical protein